MRFLLCAALGVSFLTACSGGGGSVPSPAAPGGGNGAGPLTSLPQHFDIVDLGAGDAPVAVNNAGHVAGNAGSGSNAFFYDGAMHVLGGGAVSDMNNNDVVVGSLAPSGHPGRFNLDGTTIDFGLPANYQFGYAAGVNDNGTVVVSASQGCAYDLFTYNGSSYSSVLLPAANAGRIANSGTILYDQFSTDGGCTIGSYIANTYPQAYVKIPSDAGGTGSNNDLDFHGADINSQGAAVGSYPTRDSNGNFSGTASFLALPSGTQEIDPPGGLSSAAQPSFAASGINDQNWIVGSVSTPQETGSVVWIAGTFTLLQTLVPSNSGWTLSQAIDVSNTGYIVGTGTLGGQAHGFLLVPKR